MTGREDDLATRNKQAWSQLYRSTPNLIWGRRPVEFLAPFLAAEVAAGRRFRRVLDAAAGEGRNLPVLAQFTTELTACDSSAAALRKIPSEIAAQVRQVQCDLERTPFADGEFEFVLLSDVIETLPEPLRALREMHRVLAPNGLLVCNIPGPEDEVAGLEMTPLDHNRYLYRAQFFYQFLEEAEARRLLEKAGLAVIRCELMHWEEEAHPEFRGNVHQHTSRVFLCRRAPAPE